MRFLLEERIFRALCLAGLALLLSGCGGGNETPPTPAAKAPSPPSQRTQNSPPVVRQVMLTPEKAYAFSSITAIVSGQDPDGDPVSYSYEWRVNGSVVSRAEENTLKPGSFHKGDQVVVAVTPTDGILVGNPKQSDPLPILNSSPRVRSLAILPRPASGGDRLQIQVESEDLDGDTVSYSYEWFRNGELVIGQGTENLPPELVRKGDRISAAATPFDGETRGARVVSAEVTITNSPPVIASQPPVGPTANNLYVYPVKASDPDGDPVTFSLGPSVPKGMTIDPQSGKLQWALSPESSGTFLIEIIATDKDGAKGVQRYRMTVSAPARTPSRP